MDALVVLVVVVVAVVMVLNESGVVVAVADVEVGELAVVSLFVDILLDVSARIEPLCLSNVATRLLTLIVDDIGRQGSQCKSFQKTSSTKLRTFQQ